MCLNQRLLNKSIEQFYLILLSLLYSRPEVTLSQSVLYYSIFYREKSFNASANCDTIAYKFFSLIFKIITKEKTGQFFTKVVEVAVVTEFKSQFNYVQTVFTVLNVNKVGSLREWAQGKLLLYFKTTRVFIRIYDYVNM